MSSNFGARAIFDALVTRECSLCGDFGGFFCLLTTTHCCLPCLEKAPELAVMTLTEAANVTGRSRALIQRQFPVVNTIPGIYGPRATIRKRKLQVVVKTPFSVLLYLQEELGLTGPRRSFISTPLTRYMAASSIPYLDIATGVVHAGVSCKGCHVMMENCRDYGQVFASLFKRREKVFSREEFLEHFRECEGAKALWVSSKEGTVDFKEPKFTKAGGYAGLRRKQLEN